MTREDVAKLLEGTTPGQIPEVYDAGSICNEVYWGKYRGPTLLVDSDLLTSADAITADLAREALRLHDELARVREALREAERFISYYSGETDGCFVGTGTPSKCLEQIRAALAAYDAKREAALKELADLGQAWDAAPGDAVRVSLSEGAFVATCRDVMAQGQTLGIALERLGTLLQVTDDPSSVTWNAAQGDAGYVDGKCPECGCRSWSFCAEQKDDGSFGPGQYHRCHECKLVYLPPPSAATAWTPPEDRAEVFYAFIDTAIAEAEKAMRKFPQPNYVISKVAEEAGEVVKAAIHCAENRETAENVRGEMKQLIAMLYRLWVEGDQVHGLPPLAPLPQEPQP